MVKRLQAAGDSADVSEELYAAFVAVFARVVTPAVELIMTRQLAVAG